MIPERRKHKRIYWADRTECFIGNEIFDCVIEDLSDAGACLLLTKHLNKGQIMKFVSPILMHPIKTAVCWIQECNGLYYKVGLKFITA